MTAILPDWFAHAADALRSGELAGWMALYAPDASHEFPYAPEGFPARLDGRDAIERYMRQILSTVRFGEITPTTVHRSGETTIIEATGHHRRAADGTPLRIDYVSIITRRNGLVVSYRDYMNPLQLAAL